MNFDTYDPKPFFKSRGSLIGEGEVGGKAKGLAYAFDSIRGTELEKTANFPDFNYVLSTEAFYDFITDNHIDEELNCNNCSYRNEEEDVDRLYENICLAFQRGKVRDSFYNDLKKLVEHADSCPLAIRSSSLLEDSRLLSFAGKYSTCFYVNQDNMEMNMQSLLNCIKMVWASIFNPAAKAYRKKHGFTDSDEAMGILVEPVVGNRHGNLYYPELAGTAFSKVYRRPSTRIKKEDGIMRLCFGLGTRSVDRLKARLFYLSHPALRPQGNLPGEVSMTSQTEFDFIDHENRGFNTASLKEYLPFILKEHKNATSYIELYADNALTWAGYTKTGTGKPLFSFSDFPRRNPLFFEKIKNLLSFLEEAVGIPVDMEFTYETETEQLCLIQMRPLAGYEEMAKVNIPDTPEEKIILRGDRMVSNGTLENVPYIVYIDHTLYGKDPNYFEVAREVGRINSKLAGTNYILAGPGRWGSANPMLGVPVRYNEICNCGCLVEIGISRSYFVPELSYGTHFFLDLDVDKILYLPVFEGEPENTLNQQWLDNTPFERGNHPAIRIYKGCFSVFLDGEKEKGLVQFL
jgi:hypothetical protein